MILIKTEKQQFSLMVYGMQVELMPVLQIRLNLRSFPGNVSVVTAGSGHSISANLSEAETELALEFLAYMVSPEVQAKIFTGVQANPCNTTLDLKALAEESGDPITQKLAEACTQVNSEKL